METTIAKPDIGVLQVQGIDVSGTKSPYAVEAENNDKTTFGQVIAVLVSLCGYTPEIAKSYAIKIDKDGKAIVFTSVNKKKCEELISAFGKIGVDSFLLEAD